VGFVFQNSALLSNLTVYENIAMPLRYHQYGSEADIQDLVNRALKMMMISDFKESYPYSLSLGMRRRVAVARSWALDSRILLLDEPTAGLDNNNRRNLLSLIDNMRELYKTSILMVTHDFRIAHELNCRITFLKDRELTPPVHYDELPDSTDPFIRALTQTDM
jgi:phospholipid/cholesterol/gamma-HCH transport system ATP-binding protein